MKYTLTGTLWQLRRRGGLGHGPTPVKAGYESVPSFWKVAPGEKAYLWPKCRDGGYIAIGWGQLGDLKGLDRAGFESRLDQVLETYTSWTRMGTRQVWRFANIPVGAKIVANDGTKRVVGIGTVTGPYYYKDDGTEYAHRLPVDWEDTQEREVEERGWVRTLIELPPDKFVKIVETPLPGTLPNETAPPPDRAPSRDFQGIMDRLEASGLQFPAELVSTYLLALQAKRFVILSGISGTGKTQLALAVARRFSPQASQRPDAVEDAEVVSENPTYRIIAVRPDWTDGRDLLGYYNPITKEYQATPLLSLLLDAEREVERARRSSRGERR
jgi:hypothetical protein